MKYLIGGLLGVVIIGGFVVPQVLAETTDFRLRIMPQDCIYDVVDVGTQELYYYTPEECGVLPPLQPTPESPVVEQTPVVVQRTRQPVNQTSEEAPTASINLPILDAAIEIQWPIAWLLVLLFAVPVFIRSIFRFFFD